MSDIYRAGESPIWGEVTASSFAKLARGDAPVQASSCDLARRMLHAEDFGRKHLAMTNLGTFGTVDDLTLLLPYCDYWKADRATHYWAMTAVASIRDRLNYDVNGPVVKKLR